jgi:cytochrome P450
MIKRGKADWKWLSGSFKEIGEVLASRSVCPVRPDSEQFLGGTLLVMHGEPHSERRKLEGILFGKEALKNYEVNILAPVLKSSLAELAATNRAANGVVRADLVPLTRAMLLRISTVLIGLDIEDKPEALERLNGSLEYILVGTGLEWVKGDLEDVLPEVLEYKRRYAEEFINPAKERRRALIRVGGDLPTDVITLLLVHCPEMDDEAFLRECILFLSASTRTTSSAVIHTIAELDAWFKHHPDDLEHRLESDFLRRAGMEALRLHPPSPALIRKTTHDMTLSTGRCLAGNEMLALELISANRDPEYFGDDPDAFDPWRDPKTRHYGHTFGFGPHLCLGLPLVLGTYARNDDEIDGTLVRFLRAFYEAGLTLDPHNPAQFAATEQGGYSTFPVEFTNL